MPDRRFPAGVEAAVYFVVAEALTNAARYSDASSVEVCAAQRDGRLRVVITDDGRGGPTCRARGCAGIADRVAARGRLLERDAARRGAARS